MRRTIHGKLRQKAELNQAAEKVGEGAIKAAREMGVQVGKHVEYKDMEGGSRRFGVIRKLHRKSVEIELSTKGLLSSGEFIIHKAEVPYGHVLKVIGDGQLADPAPVKTHNYLAPPRPEGYTKCDFCDGSVFEVLRVRAGIRALCREHAKVSENETEEPTFKFKLGLIYETFQAWPKPKNDLSEEPEVISNPQVRRTTSDSPYEGKRGRHPKVCGCSKHSP